MTQSTDTDKELLRWLWRGYLRRHLWLLALAFLFLGLQGSVLGAMSYMMEPMFDNAFAEGDRGALWWVGGAVFGFFCIRAVSGVMQKYILALISERSSAHIRLDLLAHIMLQDGAFHQKQPPGQLIQRVQSDVNAAVEVGRTLITGIGRDAIALVVLVGVAISVDPIWALLASVGTPLLVLPAAFAQRFVRKQARKARDLGARFSTQLDEVFHGIVPVKLNALETYQIGKFRDITRRFIRAQVQAVLGAAVIPAIIDVMAGIGFVAVLFYAGSEIVEGTKTTGQFMAFFSAMVFAFDPLRRLGALSGMWQVAASSIERVKELLEAPIVITSPAAPRTLPDARADIELESVHLAYGETTVLSDLSLRAKAGQTTALVGASGAGKSTIFNLLTRLVDPGAGSVRIAGLEARELDLPQLRALFSVVTQEALLFDDTIRENIVLGRTDVSDEQLHAVLDAANVSDFVRAMPEGLETQVGPRGSALSGGQRQRVVIARALLRDTPILLLDEATSALDAQSEKVVQEALDKLSEGRTTLVIAHRLSTIRGADKIIVMDRGAVVDEGSHDELLARGGIYADLYRLQFKDDKAAPHSIDMMAAAPAREMQEEKRSGILARLAQIWRRT